MVRACGARLIGGRQALDEPVQPIRLLVDHLQQLPRPSPDSPTPSPGAGSDQRRHRRLDRGERRAEVVRERVEQRRLQLFVPPRRLRLAGALERRRELLVELLDLAPALLRFCGCRRSARDASSPTTIAVTSEGEERNPVVGSSIPKPPAARKK